jgi:hypothetical protein
MRGEHLARHRYTRTLSSTPLLIPAGGIAKYKVESWNAFGRAATITSPTHIWTGDTVLRS